MVAAKLLLLAGIIGIAYGQTFYYDIGSRLLTGDTPTLSTPSSSRKICFDGTNLYFSSGSQINLVDGTNNPVVDTGGPAISSIACHCNILVYAYEQSGTPTSTTFVVYYDTDGSGISIALDLGNAGRVALELTPTFGLTIVGSSNIWLYDVAPLSQSAVVYGYSSPNDGNTLASIPRCIASYDNGGDLLVFVSYGSDSNVEVISIPASLAAGTTTVSVTGRTVLQGGTLEAKVACLDIDDTDLYFLIVREAESDWRLDRYSASLWVSDSPQADQRETIFSFPSENQDLEGDIRSNTNGLAVCGTGCPASCDTATCSCSTTAPVCGFCIGDDSTCQCEDSAQNGCNYEDTTLANQCLVPSPHFDSYCIVDQPLAQRRKGGAISIIGAAVSDAGFSVRRLAQTGRWNLAAGPIGNVIGNAAGPFFSGIEALLQSSARGRRFGAYVAEITPADNTINPEYIPCIATENSGFYNKFYTYTRSTGQSVTLEATFSSNLLQFMGRVRWRFTGFDPSTDSPLETTALVSCSGQLTCELNNLSETNQGVYEAFRLNRDKRTWHPIFYLFVRACADGVYGATCTSTCPECVHGVCDDFSGLCTCEPGWTGTLCNTVCNAGMVGQNCGIACGDLFTGRTDCSGLSFGVPGKVGSYCYSGFDAPECENACPTGMCGPSCRTNCDGGAATCDPRTCV